MELDGEARALVDSETAHAAQDVVARKHDEYGCRQDADNGTGYLQIMQKNLEVLRKVLN